MSGSSSARITNIDTRLHWLPNLRELWEYRTLVLLLAHRNIRVRYKQAILGFLWVLLTPAAFTAIFVMFYRLLPIAGSAALAHVPAIYCGMIVWQLVSRALNDGGTSLTANANIMTKVYFPRAIFPISALLAAIFDFLVSFGLLIGLLVWYGIPLGINMWFAPLFILWVTALVLGLTLWLSAIDGVFRDLRHALPLILQLGMFVSPIAYSTSAVVPSDWIWLYEFNPLVAPVEGLRWAMIEGAPAISASSALKSLAGTALILLTGTFFFSRMEQTIVDRI